jgi:hypothetical protein
MGAEDDLVICKGSHGNINGYWEHAAILELNREILARNGADWFTPPTTLPLLLDDDLRARMSALAGALPDRFCCKEPRLVWTADLWAEWFTEIAIVAVFRNPSGFGRSVANVWPDRFSAGSRDRDSGQMRIWEVANRRLLDLAHMFPCYWVCFDDPVETLKKRLERIIAELGGTFDANAFETFFIPSERRFSTDTDVNTSMSGLPEEIVGLHGKLIAAMLGAAPNP